MSKKADKQVVLILGGARSGKSKHALRLAERRFAAPLYVATAEPSDAEMRERIAVHKKARGERWLTVEEPLDIAEAIKNPPGNCDGILVDCATIWLSNVLLKEGEAAFEPRMAELIAALRETARSVIVVSNEVGSGIVPENALGRKFRDLAGLLNQELAEAADKVILIIAGLPIALKRGAGPCRVLGA